jgi:hypothetical protein
MIKVREPGRIRLIHPIVLFVCLAAFFLIPNDPLTPVQAAHLHVEQTSGYVQKFTPLGTYPLLNGEALILYTYDCWPEQSDFSYPVLGLATARRHLGIFWFGTGSIESHNPGRIQPGQLVDYMVAEVTGQQQIFAGRVLDESITTIEVTLNEGQVLSGKVEGSAFAILFPSQAMPLEIRALDGNGHVIQRLP